MERVSCVTGALGVSVWPVATVRPVKWTVSRRESEARCVCVCRFLGNRWPKKKRKTLKAARENAAPHAPSPKTWNIKLPRIFRRSFFVITLHDRLSILNGSRDVESSFFFLRNAAFLLDLAVLQRFLSSSSSVRATCFLPQLLLHHPLHLRRVRRRVDKEFLSREFFFHLVSFFFGKLSSFSAAAATRSPTRGACRRTLCGRRRVICFISLRLLNKQRPRRSIAWTALPEPASHQVQSKVAIKVETLIH